MADEVELYDPVHRLATDRPIWTRQPDETNREWAWFCLYRDLHPAVRSVSRAYYTYREASGREWVHKQAPPMLQNMSHTWSWSKRAAEYDAYVDTEHNLALAEAKESAMREVAELGRNMRRVAALALQGLREDIFDEVVDPVTGAVSYKFKETLSPSAIVRLAKAGVELERLGLGMDDMRGSKAGAVSVQVAVAAGVSPRQMLRSDEDLIKTAAEIIAANRLQKQVLEGEFEYVEEPEPVSKVTMAIQRPSPKS